MADISPPSDIEQTARSEPKSRRDFLYIATAAMGTVGAAAALVPLIAQMNPDASTLAAGGPLISISHKFDLGSKLSSTGEAGRYL